MERLEKKIIKGHTYYYYTKWEWVKGKTRRVWQKYLGRLQDIAKAVEGGGPSPKQAEVFEWGLSSSLWQQCCRAKIIAKVDEQCPKREQGLTVGEYIAIAAINRAIEPRSKNTLYEWFSKTALLRKFPNASKIALGSQRFWDNLNLISAKKGLAIWKEIIKHILKQEGIDLSSVCYDGTNFYTFIDTFNSHCEIAKRGKNKQGRANLRQIGYALFCNTKDQVPLYYEVYQGNRNDAKQFPIMLKNFFEFIKETTGQCVQDSQVTLIFDKGNNSKENFQLIDQLNLHYVGSKKLCEMKNLAEISNNDPRFTPCKAIGLETTKAFCVTQKVYSKERTVVVSYNQNLFNTQQMTLHNDIAKAITELDALDHRLKDRAAGLITGGQCPTKASIEKQCKAILTRQYLKEIITYQVKQEGEKVPTLTYKIDSEAIERIADTYLGKNILITSRKEWSNEQIITAYRSQFNIENVFKEMKDRDIGSWWPVYHWTNQKIHVHALYCTIAVLLRALAHRRVEQAGIHISMTRMLSELEEIKEILILYPRKRQDRKERFHTVLSKTSELQQTLMSILGAKMENTS